MGLMAWSLSLCHPALPWKRTDQGRAEVVVQEHYESVVSRTDGGNAEQGSDTSNLVQGS